MLARFVVTEPHLGVVAFDGNNFCYPIYLPFWIFVANNKLKANSHSLNSIKLYLQLYHKQLNFQYNYFENNENL